MSSSCHWPGMTAAASAVQTRHRDIESDDSKTRKHYSNTKRNPLLLLRFSGVLLLRFAQRTLFGSLFQEPPRKTREDPELPIRPLQPGAQKATQLIQLFTSITQLVDGEKSQVARIT